MLGFLLRHAFQACTLCLSLATWSSFAMEAPSAPHITFSDGFGDAINQVGQCARPTRGYEPTREAAMAAFR
jgi:hypothetical protein